MTNYLNLLYSFVLFVVGLSAAWDYPQKPLQESYDYVVVGSGSAGAVVTDGLSENGMNSVLTLEAGGPPPALTEVPMFAYQIRYTEIDWRGKMETQDNSCQENPDGVCWWTRVRGLGGCSSHNLMCYNRGNRKDFDNWEEQFSATGWRYSEVLPTFKRLENNTDLKINSNGYHGTSGYMTVSPSGYRTTIGKAFMEGGEQLGMKINDDYNGESQEGFSYVQTTTRDGKRCSTEKAFLRPASQRENLQILTHAYVRKITFDDNKRIKSVIFDYQNKTEEVLVNKEVVLSAGALSSPQILLLSGVGPKEHLKEMEIPVISDIPVGQNLQDHPWVTINNYVLNDSVGIVYNSDVNPQNIGLYGEGKGPLTSAAYLEVTGFLNSKYQQENEKSWPDLMWHSGNAVMYPIKGTDFSDKNSTGFMVTLLRPRSRGFVKLRSTNPHDDPIVDPKYFSDPDDMKRYIEGIKSIVELMNTPALQKYNPQITPKILVGCEGLEGDAYWECGIRKYLGGGFHLSGSCRMGGPTESTSVVDPQLRVVGVTGVRVADASIMPLITSSNLNAPSQMIGRKCADMILAGN